MTPRERFLAALRREPTDVICVANPTSIATADLMEKTGCFFPEVHTDAEKMAILAAAGHELLGYDTVAPYFSVVNEAAALGCAIDWGDSTHMPTVRSQVFRNPEDVHVPHDFLDRLPVRTILDAIRLLKRRFGDEVAVVGKVFGGWTLAYHLFGIEDFLISVVDDPGKVHHILDKLKEFTVLFANAQVEAGADAITLGDHLTGDICRAEAYREFLLPVHQELAPRITCPVVLHICGYTLDRLDFIARSGFAAFHIDSRNDPHAAAEIARGRIVLTGNINNPITLLQGDAERIAAEVTNAVSAGIPIIAPECAVPLNMHSRWLKEIVDVARSKHTVRRSAADNKYLHRDFHGAVSVGIEYLDQNYGQESVRDYLRQFARSLYAPVREDLCRRGLVAVQEHFTKMCGIEEANVEFIMSDEELIIKVSHWPALAHMRARGYPIARLFSETARTVSEALCEGTPYATELLEYDCETGRNVQRFYRRAT